ncbi:MAG: hypothetical protein H0U55_14580 [Rubrobacteraceae bacterium]|nr:hypothetical protein [Rubrobacteraceae bacterium]
MSEPSNLKHAGPGRVVVNLDYLAEIKYQRDSLLAAIEKHRETRYGVGPLVRRNDPWDDDLYSTASEIAQRKEQND